MPKPVAFKPPKSLPACADLLASIRAERLAADKVAEGLKAKETILKEHLINNVPKDSAGAMGKLYTATITTKTKPRVADWPLLWAHIKKTGEFDLMQRRLSDTAVMDRINDKRKLPGVETFTYVDVSLTKNTRS